MTHEQIREEDNANYDLENVGKEQPESLWIFLQLFSITEIIFFNNLKKARCAYVQKYG